MGLSPAHLPRTEEIGLDGRVLSFTSGLSLLAGLLFGLVPAWQAARPDLSKAIQGAGASSVGHFRRQGLRQWLGTGEVGIADTLLVWGGVVFSGFCQELDG